MTKLRSITTQFSSFQAAVHSFKDKYFAIPGDMPNATSFWGTAAAGASCITTAGTGTQTCNGNGNGQINDASYPGLTSNETFRFWQHLANAGLIEGTYDGIAHGSTTFSTTEANAPRGKISGMLWFSYSWGDITNAPHSFDGSYYNNITPGLTQANSTPGLLLKPEELWNLDTKVDDGKPATGTVKARFSSISACTDTSSTSNFAANYLLNSSTIACSPNFVKGY